jgi:uncharacterized protein (TIGR02466 family)
MNGSDFNPDQHLQWEFPTPIIRYRWPDCEQINADLRSSILNAEATADSRFANVIGGWATSKSFLAWDVPCIRELAAHIEGLLESAIAQTARSSNTLGLSSFTMQSWANVLRSGGYHAPHAHPNCYWSGAYYVSVGKTDDSTPFNGQIELFDPRSAVNASVLPGSIFQNKCRIEPEPGLAVLFPSWVKHMVHPFHGEGERISVAFNLLRK